MKKNQLNVLILVLIIIGFGLLSRTSIIPDLIYPYLGDVLYSAMMFFVFRFFLLRPSSWKITFLSIGLCFLIELSQLYQAEWLETIRNTTLGSLTLGHGFLWSDLVAYSMGGVLGLVLDQKLFKAP